MIEVVDKRDVVVVRFEDDIGVDVLEGVDGGVDLGQASLVGLEEQPVHVGKLHLEIDEDRFKSRTHFTAEGTWIE